MIALDRSQGFLPSALTVTDRLRAESPRQHWQPELCTEPNLVSRTPSQVSARPDNCIETYLAVCLPGSIDELLLAFSYEQMDAVTQMCVRPAEP